MSDYTNTFGGVVKDRNSATILGADWDTEYDNIATMSATKMNLVGSAVDGDLIQVDGSSPAGGEASGIGSVNLDGLTGVVETRIATLEQAAVPTNFIKAGDFYFADGSQSLTGFQPTTDYNLTSRLVGDSSHPTAYGNWSALDLLAGYEVTSIRVNVTNTNTSIGLFPTSSNVSAATASAVTPLPGSGNSKSFFHTDHNDTGQTDTRTHQFWIPITTDDDGPSFKLFWSQAGNSVITFHLAGFSVGT